MQDPDKAVTFLTSCLDFDAKLKVINNQTVDSISILILIYVMMLYQIIQEVEGPGVMSIGANAKDKDGKSSLQE